MDTDERGFLNKTCLASELSASIGVYLRFNILGALEKPALLETPALLEYPQVIGVHPCLSVVQIFSITTAELIPSIPKELLTM